MIKKLTDPVLQNFKAAATDLVGKNICVLVDESGKVLDISDSSSYHFKSIIPQLKASGNVRELFDYSRITPHPYAGREGQTIPSIPGKIDLVELMEPFYSIFPLAVLNLFPLKGGGSFGVITPTSIVPVTFDHSNGTVVYLNDLDQLVAYFHTFYDHFGKGVAKPSAMLHRESHRFFSPSPGQIQEKYLDRLRPFPPEAGHVVKQNDFSKEVEDSMIRVSPETHAKKTTQRLWISSPPGEETFVTLTKPLGFQKKDLRIDIDFGNPPDEVPCVVFGDANEEKGYKEYKGYLVGPGFKEDRYILKRRALVISGKAVKIDHRRVKNLTVIKRGSAFTALINGKEVFSATDLDFLPRSEAFVSIYVRPNNSCTLKTLMVRARESETPPLDKNLIVKNKKGQFYLLNQFYGFQLAASNGTLLGYRLQNVTDIQSRVTDLENRYREQKKEEARLRALLSEFEKEKNLFLGSSRTISSIREKASRVAGASTTILIQGPTGTGKEVLAKFIHEKSAQAGGPFLKVDCSTLPKTLMESELFGYEEGAFTGAQKKKIGLLEKANGGTIFLDELNNLTLDTQAKLLQFLQDNSIMRVGGDRPIRLKLRIVGASNQDLQKMVGQNAFREDLYFRIAVVTIHLPPLKNRMDDLPELCQHFLDLFNDSYQKNISGISPAAFRKMYRYAWPGNIRELKNAMERAVLFCDGQTMEPEHVLIETREPNSGGTESDDLRRKINVSKEILTETMARHQGVIKRAADELGVTPRALYYHFRKNNISPNDFRKRPRKPNRPT